MDDLKTSSYEPIPDEKKKRKYNLCYLVFATLTATLNSFLCGYQIGVFNTCQNNVSHSLGWGDNKTVMISVMNFLMPIGAIVGSMSAGIAANKLGRKWAMVVNCCLMVLSAGLVMITQNVISNSVSFSIARFLGGIVAGQGSTIPPIFGIRHSVKEIVPVEISGVLGSLVQFELTLGIVVSYAMGIPLPWHDYGEHPMNEWWRAMFALPVIPAALQVILLVGVIRLDSPLWLMERGRNEEAERHLKRIYTAEYYSTAVNELRASLRPKNLDMEEVHESQKLAAPGYRELFGPEYGRALFIACGNSLFQQLCGINTFIFYSSSIFDNMGGHKSMSNVYTTILGAVNMGSTLLSLPFIDSKCYSELGRKVMLLQGCVGMAVCLGVLGVLSAVNKVAPLQLVVMLLYVAFFETSLGPVTWIYASEVVPDRGMSIVLLINWLFTGIVGLTFPFMSAGDALRVYGAFWVYCGLCVVAAVFTLIFVIETKGLSREEIKKKLSPKKH